MKSKNFFEGKSREEIKKFFEIKTLKNFLIEHFHKRYTPNYIGDVKVDAKINQSNQIGIA